jgi:hypothetical protein
MSLSHLQMNGMGAEVYGFDLIPKLPAASRRE